MRGGRAVVDYHHSSGGSRYRDGGTGSSSDYGSAPGYGNVSGYGASFGYGGNPHYSSASGYGGASTYEGAYGSGHPGGGSAYSSAPSYGGGSNYGGPSSYGSGQMVSPWESGMAPGSVGGSQHGFVPPPRGSGGAVTESGGGDASNIIGAVNQLTQMGTTESKLALNILNAVLTKGSPGDEGRANWDNGPPANKMRRMEWDGGYGNRPGRAHPPPMPPPPVRKLPQRDQQNIPRQAFGSPQRGRGGHSYGPAGRHMMTDNQLRKTAKAMRGKPMPDTRDNKGVAKDQKKGAPAAATRTAVGQKGDKTEGDGSSATAGPKQSGATDLSKNKAKQGEETSDDKENAEGTDNSEKNAKAKKDAFVPRELLKCHMCDIDNFDCINHYQKHLQSKGHKTSALAFHAQGAAILQVLRAEAKLASQRQILKAWKSGVRGRGNLSLCGKCQCHVIGSLQDHNKTIEHLLVARYMKVKCCDQAYTVRGDLEEHRLSLLHFKWQMEMEQKMNEREEKKMESEAEGITEEDALKMFYDAVDKHKADDSEEEIAALPEHDPSVPVGLHMIGTRSIYHCKVCPDPKVRMLNEHHVEAHFRSISHYLNLFAHLKKMQEMKNIERKKKQEEKKKQQEEEKQEEKKQKEDVEMMETNGEVKQTSDEKDDKEQKSPEDADNTESIDEVLDDADVDISKDTNKDSEEKSQTKDKDDTDMAEEMEFKNTKGKKEEKNKQKDEKQQEEKQEEEEAVVQSSDEQGSTGEDEREDVEQAEEGSEQQDDVESSVRIEESAPEEVKAKEVKEEVIQETEEQPKIAPASRRRGRGRGRGRFIKN
ncbi:uncharacterized protein [Panulirus ornatus]|uniref:uncharacterized protein isoform X2 n=1 Tax=Panulirus ornatus TaxID=150431 RepID=UPI003A887B02